MSQQIDIVALIKKGKAEGVSHLYFKCDKPVLCRKNGEIQEFDSEYTHLWRDDIEFIMRSLVPHDRYERFEEYGQTELGCAIDGVGRLQVVAYRELGSFHCSLKYLDMKEVSSPYREVPADFKKLMMKKQGLLLFTGTDSAKNTWMLQHLLEEYEQKRVMILGSTKELKISSRNKLTTYREVGMDCETYQSALNLAMRDKHDVVIIPELNQIETVEMALNLAMSGTLVVSCAYTQTVVETIMFYLAMGVNPSLLSNGLAGIMSTTVVPSLCYECKHSRDATEKEADLLKAKRKERIVLSEAGGCSSCEETGYFGEKVFTEVMVMNRSLRYGILSKLAVEDLALIVESACEQSIRSKMLAEVKNQMIAMNDL